METKNSINEGVLRHAFFGEKSCVSIEHGKNGTFLKVGKKNGNGWTWEKAKLALPELGDIITVLKGKTDRVSFFHQFNGNKTQISVNREPDKGMVFFKVEDHAKPLNIGEQEVLAVLLEKIIEQRLKDNAIDNGEKVVTGAENPSTIFAKRGD